MKIARTFLILTVTLWSVWGQGTPQGPPPSGPPNFQGGGRGGSGRGGGGGRGPAVKTLAINADHTVTFRLRAPNAKEVTVSGVGRGQLGMTKIGSFSGADATWPESTRTGATLTSAPVPDDVIAKSFPGLDSKANSQLKLFWIACGTSDPHNIGNRQFKAWLKGRNVQSTDIETEGGHSWDVCEKT